VTHGSLLLAIQPQPAAEMKGSNRFAAADPLCVSEQTADRYAIERFARAACCGGGRIRMSCERSIVQYYCDIICVSKFGVKYLRMYHWRIITYTDEAPKSSVNNLLISE
jgi:hypothetical protein